MQPELKATDELWYLAISDKGNDIKTIRLHPNLMLEVNESGELVGITCLGKVTYPVNLVKFFYITACSWPAIDPFPRLKEDE